MTIAADLAVSLVSVGAPGAVAASLAPRYRSYRAAKREHDGEALRADIERLETELGMREDPVEAVRWDGRAKDRFEPDAVQRLIEDLKRLERNDAAYRMRLRLQRADRLSELRKREEEERQRTAKSMGWTRKAGKAVDATGKPCVYQLENGLWYLAQCGEADARVDWVYKNGALTFFSHNAHETWGAAMLALQGLHEEGRLPPPNRKGTP